MIHIRFRIIASLVVALLVANLFGRLSTTPFISSIQADNIKSLLGNIKFPTINFSKIFSLKTDQDNDNSGSSSGTFNFVTSAPLPTVYNEFEDPTPTLNPLTPTKPSTLSPTTKLTPTKTPTPKPTSTPKPTPTQKPAAITSATRPGSSLEDIFQEVEKRICIPAALLHAFQTQETGPWWPYNTASSKVKIYNTYGWWLDGTGNSCTGMGYHTQTGIVPADAVDAGTVCQNPIPSGADQGIMGILQISKFEEDAAKKYMTGIIKGSIDRRVLFDNTVIFAIITKNRLGTPPSNCSNWPDDVVREAAEKHYGSCGDNYCANILKYYKQYR